MNLIYFIVFAIASPNFCCCGRPFYNFSWKRPLKIYFFLEKAFPIFFPGGSPPIFFSGEGPPTDSPRALMAIPLVACTFRKNLHLVHI